MARSATRSKHPGIETRHTRSCASRSGSTCSCKPSYQAHVWSAREKKRIRKTFTSLSEAKAWRHDASVALRRGTMKAPTATTLQQAWDAWLAGAKDGSVRTRSGDVYKPSVIRSYEASMRLRILPKLDTIKLSEIRRADLQTIADEMLAAGRDPSTIRNALMPLRVIFRRALVRSEIAVNPTAGLELPAVRGRRDRIVSPTEAADLIATLPEGDRALWATAMYAGLRRGELMALRWEDVALGAGVIRVERSWDVHAGVVEPKSRAGERSVPIARALREQLIQHRLRSGRSEGPVFGRSAAVPFNHSSVVRRATVAWRDEAVKRARDVGATEAEIKQLTRDFDALTLHEARHTFASLAIAAGVNAKALSTYMGHSSVTITYDRYGHLMPGNEEEAAELLDNYLARPDTTARLAHL